MSDTTTIDLPKLPEGFRSSRELLDECFAAGDKYRQIKSIPESRRGDTWDADRRKAAAELLELDQEFTLASKIEGWYADQQARKIEAELAEKEAEARSKGEIRGPGAAFLQMGEHRTAGEMFVESDAYKNGDRRRSEPVEVRNLLTGTSLGTSGSHLFVPVGTPLYSPQTNQRRRLFVRDLLSVQQTGLASVPYIRELNASTNETGATTVKEASAKPEVTMQFEQDDAPIRKIAGWIQATNEALDDAPTLRGYIDTRLGYMVLLAEETQVLGGNGTSPNIKGIRTFSVQTASGEMYAGIASGIGKIENVDGDADGVVVNPLDYWAAVADRHAEQFDGQPNSAGNAPFGTPTPTAWGLPVVRSRSIESGKALVGAFRLGATLFEREGVTIRSTDSHASLFISNTVVILAEERIGLAVHRADWFCEVTVTPPS